MHSLISIRDFIRWGASRFDEAGLYFGHGTDNALDEAAALVLYALHMPYDLPAVWFDSRLTQEEKDRVLGLIRRRIDERIPLPYLTGESWFAGLRFVVNPHVLIPRSPIAELIEGSFEPWIDSAPVRHVLDLCCGSGCIGIASAVYLPETHVDLVDISDQALAVAEENILEHNLKDRVRLIKSDLFSSLAGEEYDVIVTNPPYVGRFERMQLPEEYAHEPVIALEAEDEGLSIVTRILREAGGYLTPGGILVVEVGYSAELLMQRYPDIPFTWIDFERGGEGVFIFTAEELDNYHTQF